VHISVFSCSSRFLSVHEDILFSYFPIGNDDDLQAEFTDMFFAEPFIGHQFCDSPSYRDANITTFTPCKNCDMRWQAIEFVAHD
jgi:hypothetical protein